MRADSVEQCTTFGGSFNLKSSNQIKARDYTPEILVKNGVSDKPMLITQRHVKSVIYTESEAKKIGLPTNKGIHYHGLGKDLLIKAIDNMDNPSEIYKQDSKHYLIITEIKNNAGDNVIIPVKIDGKGAYNDVYIDENQIKSVYGKSNLGEYLKRNNFERVYTKKGIALNEGIQFPNISNSFKNNILEKTENVNGKQKKQYSLSEADSAMTTEVDSDIKYSLYKYTEKQLKNWKASKNIIVYEGKEQLTNFISEAKEGKLGNQKMYFGVVPESLAEMVMEKTGVDIRNRNVTLGAYEVQKIFKEHGNEYKEAQRGQRAVTVDDFENIIDVIESPDNVELSTKQYNGRPVLEFSKVIGDKVTVVTYDSQKHYDLRVQTLYINKRRSLTSATDEQASVNTPKATSGTASNESISSDEKEGNTKYSLTDNQGRQLTKEQQKFFRDSKVRDEDGNLRVVYHGSSEDFTVFDRTKARANMDIQGNFFSPWDLDAQGYGENVS